MSTQGRFNMSRRKKFDLRSAMYQMEQKIPRSDFSKSAERERDLLATINCAIWDNQMYKIAGCLTRLAQMPERGPEYGKLMELLAL